MTKRVGLVILMGAVALAVGAAIGYYYRDRSANFAVYDSYLADLGVSLLMMDAVQEEKHDVLEEVLSSDVEGKISAMILLYDEYKFAERDFARCVVTRKARALYGNRRILVSRARLEERGYPYDQVITYFASHCEGEPSHTDWTTVDLPADEKEETTVP